MAEIDFNTENICNLYKSILSVKEKINSLITAISSVEKSDLSTAELLETINKKLESYNDLEISLLEFKIMKTIELLSIDLSELEELYDLTKEYYDDSAYSTDGFNYVTDPDELVEIYDKGLHAIGSLSYYYGKKILKTTQTEGMEYITYQIEKIWNNENYSPREKSVNAQLKFLELGADIGKSQLYKFAGNRGTADNKKNIDITTLANGIDCCAWSSWGIWGDPNVGGEEWMSVADFAEAGRATSYDALQPGDVAVKKLDEDKTPGHVVTIIKNNPETGECIISEAPGPLEGIRIRTMTYKELEDAGLLPRDMGCYFGEW